MSLPRIRISIVSVSIALVAALLAFYRWRLKAPRGLVEVIPFELLVVVLAIILVTLAVMLRAFRQK
jgi:hypothetical protein